MDFLEANSKGPGKLENEALLFFHKDKEHVDLSAEGLKCGMKMFHIYKKNNQKIKWHKILLYNKADLKILGIEIHV